MFKNSDDIKKFVDECLSDFEHDKEKEFGISEENIDPETKVLDQFDRQKGVNLKTTNIVNEILREIR